MPGAELVEPLALPVDEDRTLGRYRLRYRVARGGMGSVYLAQVIGAHGFERWVAIKIIHPHLADERRFVDMFLDEARVMAPLQHSNVCSVLDFGEDGGVPYIVMEYLHGEAFSSVLRRAREGGKMPIGLALRTVADAARGLHAAHELCSIDGTPLGVVHRDVSPQNIHVLYDGASKVVDFGVARARGRLTTSNVGEVKGKFSYMAPETASGNTIDRRADVFSLGVVLWEALALRRLFLRDNEAETLLAILNEPTPTLAAAGAKVPAAIEDVVQRATAKNVGDRVASAELLADEIEKILFGMGEPWGAAQVSAWMRTSFADRFAARNAMLRAAPLPIGEVPDVEISPTSSGAVPLERASALRPAPASVPRRWRFLALALGALVALVAIFWATMRQPAPPPTHTTRSARSAPASGEPTSGAAPTEHVPTPTDGVATPTESPDAPPPPEPPPAGAEPDKQPAPVARAHTGAPGLLNLLSVPNAQVSEGGRRLGRTPLLRLPLRPGRHTLRLRSDDGRKRATIRVTIESGGLTAKSVRLGRR